MSETRVEYYHVCKAQGRKRGLGVRKGKQGSLIRARALFLRGKCPILPLQETSLAASVELRRDSISARVLSLSLSARRTRCVDRRLKMAPAYTFEATRMKPGSVKQRAALSLSARRVRILARTMPVTRYGSREWVICCCGRGAGLRYVKL
jgi:hypothetical protein